MDALSRDELKSMIDSLTQENAQLRDQLVDYENTLQENEQLKVQLEITEEEPENTLRAATVIGRDPNDVFYGFSIDQGTLNGVEAGDPVITQSGLVGIVSQAYATTSKVTTLLSEDVKVSAVDSACGESGVIASDIASASSGLLRLEYLPATPRRRWGTLSPPLARAAPIRRTSSSAGWRACRNRKAISPNTRWCVLMRT